jgi:superfamily II DNA or RNA helicase
MIILDEIHLISKTATEYNRILKFISTDPEKAILGLTATINEQDPRFANIMSIAPPVKKYMIRDAVTDGRLAEPRIIPITVNLTPIEEKMYRDISKNITNLSRQLGDFDPKKISSLLKSGGYRSRLAKAWFRNVRERKELLSESRNKLREAVKIVRKHNSEPIMIFSETIKSIRKLEGMLREVGIEARCIHNEISSIDRKKILEEWGKNFFPLLSVHTLEIGYDIPNVRIAIIISNNSNNNQIAQRIGRVIRKTTQKDYALIYVIFVKDTKDNNILRMAKSTINGRVIDRQMKLTFFN